MRSLLSTLTASAALALCFLHVVTNSAGAGTSIDIMVPGQPTVTVNDGDAVDLDPDSMEIEYDFSVSHPLGYWTATGKVIATGGELVPVTTIVTNTLIQKHFGVLLNDEIKVIHYFDSWLTAQPYWAELQGEYDNLVFANIGVADLTYIPSVNNESIGVIDPPAAIGVPGPVPFLGSVGPLYPAQPAMSQTILMLFYLDIEGDAIRLFNSAEIKPTPPAAIPTLGEWGLVVVALLLIVAGTTVIWRRQRSV